MSEPGVAIIGVGMTKIKEHWDKSIVHLLVESGLEAMDDASQKEEIHAENIDIGFLGIAYAGSVLNQRHIGPMLAEQVGLASARAYHIPVVRVESADASGGFAFFQAYLAIKSGEYKIAVVSGVEKLSDYQGITYITSSSLDREYEASLGGTPHAMAALITRRHMHEFNTTREQLALIAVKNHENGFYNPKAQFRKKISIEDVLDSEMISDPLRTYDFAPETSDGAATVILADSRLAKKYTDDPIYVLACAGASDSLALHNRKNFVELKSVVQAAKNVYKKANITPRKVDFVEAHDFATIYEILAYEDLGFVKKGKGGKAIEEELTTLKGEIPFNPSGGLKARGHPVGATGVAQIVESVLQLRGKADGRQVKGAKIGLTENIGGTGATAVISLLCNGDAL